MDSTVSEFLVFLRKADGLTHFKLLFRYITKLSDKYEEEITIDTVLNHIAFHEPEYIFRSLEQLYHLFESDPEQDPNDHVKCNPVPLTEVFETHVKHGTGC